MGTLSSLSKSILAPVANETDDTQGAALVGYDNDTVKAALDLLNTKLTNARTVSVVAATADGQATFTIPGGYPVNLIDVSLVGSDLASTIDYNATDGQTVVLVAANAAKVKAGMNLVVKKFGSFAVANALELTTLGAPGGAALVGWDTASIASFFTNHVSKQVASVAELRTVDPTKYKQVYRQGFSTPGDKGHLGYVYVPSISPPPDNGGLYVSALGNVGYWLGLVAQRIDAEVFGWPALKEVAINNAIQAAAQLSIGVVNISTPGFIAAPIVFPLNFGVVLEGINQESLLTVQAGIAIDSVITSPDFETKYTAQPGSSTNGAVRDCGLRHIAIDGNINNVPVPTNWMKGMGIRCLWLRPILQDVSLWNIPGIGGISVFPTSATGVLPPGYHFADVLDVDTKIRDIDGLYIHNTGFEGFIWEGPSDTSINNLFVGWPSASLNTGLYDPTKKSLKFTTGGIVYAGVTARGVNYTAPVITVNDATGTGAVLEAMLLNGVISIVGIANGGANYTAPTVAVTDVTGYGAVIHLTVTGGVITGAVVVSGGDSYTAPVFTITDATGTGAVLTGTLINGVLDRVLIDQEGYTYSNPTYTINDPTGTGAALTLQIDNTCDGLVFNDQGAELNFVHSFNNANGWAINFRSTLNGFPRITGRFVMGESSLGNIRIGGHTRFQIGNIDVHGAGAGNGPAGFPSLLVRSDRGGVIGTVTDYRQQGVPQGMPSVLVGGTNNRICGGTIFGRGVTGDGVVLTGSQNDVTMSVTGCAGAALVTDGATISACKASINNSQSTLCWNHKSNSIHMGSVFDVVNQHLGTTQFRGLDKLTPRQWQECRVVSTDARGFIVSNKDIRFGTADCTLTTVQNIVIPHNSLRVPTTSDIVITVTENSGASMTLENVTMTSATGPVYNAGNPVIVQGTVTVAVKFKTAGTGTALVRVNFI